MSARKTDRKKWVAAGLIPDCRFRILLHVSGGCWNIEEQWSQNQLYPLLWNIWKHNSKGASCGDKWKEKHTLHPTSEIIDYIRSYPLCWYTVSIEITLHWQFYFSDRKHIPIRDCHCVSFISLTLKQSIFSVALLRLNEALKHLSPCALSHKKLCLPCSSPLCCKIYEKCPGAHEMLPRLIPCDRITTVSALVRELIQDEVHWSSGEGEGGEEEKGVEWWQKEWGGERMRISLYSGPQRRAAARLI